MGDSPDLIDYTALEKRGLIKKKEIINHAVPVSKDGFIDFSAIGQDKINQIVGTASSNQSSAQSSPIQQSSPTPTFSSFWDNVPGAQQSAQTASSTTSSADANYYGNQSSTTPLSASSDNSDISALKVKLDDLEYKLSKLTETLDLITSKLSSFEDKVT